MLFNSPFYIFLFLPFVFGVYFFLNRYRLITASKSWLVFASIFFYSYWNPIYLPLILGSMIINYGLGTSLSGDPAFSGKPGVPRRVMLLIGVFLNLALLGYYKYADFFLVNVNYVTGRNFDLLHLALPLAISFFTFQQIAYLVDSYEGQTREYDFLNYCLFVTFFPQLIAGPIVHHGEMMPQFKRLRNKVLNYQNLSLGLFIFTMGLFKKVVIADYFAEWANIGFATPAALGLVDAWAASLSYALQLYFDFSGYTDMAIGSAYMFNIVLPLNFNSPYKAVNIQDFWRRWHMTLSRWLRDYLYIPLGGNRKGPRRTYVNLFLTFFLGGLWHGAGWTFVAWGALHGAGTSVQKFWQDKGFCMPKWLGWLATFAFVNFAWVYFRADSFDNANQMLAAMGGFNGLDRSGLIKKNIIYLALAGLMVCVFAPNSMEWKERFKPNWKYAIAVALMAVVAFLHLTRVSEFLYFQF